MGCYRDDPVWKQVQSFLPQENRLTRFTLPEESFLRVSDCELHIDSYKPACPRGRVVLFHGVGGNGRCLSMIAVPLMKNGFEVICPDLPLYGYTRYKEPVTYATWVSCGTELVNHYQEENPLPTFLFGLSAGGMLAYQIASACEDISGLIVTCILDQRNKTVRKRTARNPVLGMLAPPALGVLQTVAGTVKVPMKWVGNMKAIANNQELTALLIKDKKASGAMVPLCFLHSMLNLNIKIEPENFHKCPVLLIHPGEDRWTDYPLSALFYDRLACDKKTVMLDGAGHFPIERLGLGQMEAACVDFINRQLCSQ